MGRPSILGGLGLIVLVVVAAEAWRLKHPSSVRLRQTLEFATPQGPKTGSAVIELRQQGAIPYLPGGETGHYEVAGKTACVLIAGTPIFLKTPVSNWPDWGAKFGTVTPPVARIDKGRLDRTDAEFYRRLRHAKATIVAPVEDLPPDVQAGISLTSQDPDVERRVTRFPEDASTTGPPPRFAETHGGARLVRVTLSVTRDPIGREGPACN